MGRSVSLQRVSSQQSENIAGARSQSLSRTGEDPSARSFLSAMTGGLYDAGSRRHSRPGSRQSSGERSSVLSWSLEDTDQSMVSGDLDNSLLGQFKKLKPCDKLQKCSFSQTAKSVDVFVSVHTDYEPHPCQHFVCDRRDE